VGLKLVKWCSECHLLYQHDTPCIHVLRVPFEGESMGALRDAVVACSYKPVSGAIALPGFSCLTPDVYCFTACPRLSR